MHQLKKSGDNNAAVADVMAQLRDLMGAASTQDLRIASLSSSLLESLDREQFNLHADFLNETCAYLFDFGASRLGISLAKSVAQKAEEFKDLHAHRRVANIIGAQYCDVADYALAMEYLEKAIQLARQIGSPTIEAACLANVVATLQEMGHYRQAIIMSDRVIQLSDDSAIARSLKIQCASIGLYAAHRVGDNAAAAQFLTRGETYLSGPTEPLRRAFFEKNRVSYLVDLGDLARAKRSLTGTQDALKNIQTPKTRILMSIASSICDWAHGDRESARHQLDNLYRDSRHTRFYHHFVLQALVKIYSDSTSPDEAAVGMQYARELVEFTTSVKKAKFYRQLATKQESREVVPLENATIIDAFEVARDWLTSTEVTGPGDESDAPEKRLLAKHEELTVIHEDMARLRARSLRREIRTDAVGTAENWAIAAELFDDETGQHCYRVGHLASMLAREIGMDETFCIQVEHAARLHDIGKIAVNEVILLKPGPLDASEMAAMRLHTEVGAQILSGSDDPTLKMATEIARHHHEWWNGNGYPTKLVGKNIPLSARVCAYADVYDALTHMRSYKKAWSHERALDEIIRLSSTQFDPDLLHPFGKVIESYRKDLAANMIPGFADMDTNALIASRKRLMKTIGG